MLEIKTFGCRLNFFESEMIRKLLENESQNDKWCVFNSCAITGEAFRQLKQQIRKYARENPEFKIFITGCSAQVEFKEIAEMSEVFKVIDNRNKLNIGAYVGNDKMVACHFDKMETQQLPNENQIPEKFVMHTKAFVQIQQGCNNFCTYCIVPYTRGRSVNFEKNLIFKQIRTFLENGYKELTITGVDIASFAEEKGYNNRLDSRFRGNDGDSMEDIKKQGALTKLIQEILDKFENWDFRLRLSSIDPAYSDFDGIFEIMKNNKKLTPFLHLSMQSGDDDVLKSMNRRHRAQDLRELIKKGREIVPSIAYGADLIMGFYSETDERFENTYNLIKELRLEHLHVFPYSVRPMTASYLFGDPVPTKIKKERVGKILELNKQIVAKRMNEMIGEKVEVLSEGKWGYTDNYFKVLLNDENSKGETLEKKLVSITDNEFFCV